MARFSMAPRRQLARHRDGGRVSGPLSNPGCSNRLFSYDVTHRTQIPLKRRVELQVKSAISIRVGGHTIHAGALMQSTQEQAWLIDVVHRLQRERGATCAMVACGGRTAEVCCGGVC